MSPEEVTAKTSERGMFPSCRLAGADGRELVVVGMKWRGSHEPWRTWMDSLAEMARKWVGHPPGIVTIHFSDSIDDLEAVSPGLQANDAIQRWTEKLVGSGAIAKAQAETILADAFPPQETPSMDRVLLRMIGGLPQFAAVMFSTEPDLTLGKQGIPGSLWTLPTRRLPGGFPSGQSASSTRRVEQLAR